jgi:hypothetical protein
MNHIREILILILSIVILAIVLWANAPRCMSSEGCPSGGLIENTMQPDSALCLVVLGPTGNLVANSSKFPCCALNNATLDYCIKNDTNKRCSANPGITACVPTVLKCASGVFDKETGLCN